MADEEPGALRERVDQVERRLESLEKEVNREHRGPLAKVKTLAIVVGCLGGILGGTSTILQLRRDLGATPSIVLEPSALLRLDWNAADERIDFKCLMRLTNNGNADGNLETLRAHLKTCDGSEARFTVGSVVAVQKTTLDEFGKAIVVFPVTVNARSFRDIELTIPSGKIAELDGVFGIERPYELEIELDPTDIKPRGQVYSFALGQGAIAQLTGPKKSYSQTTPDPRCQSKEKA